MKPSEGYILRRLHGEPYLLPIGQNIALHKRGVRLNDTGVFLWNCITQGADKKDLFPLFLQHCPSAAASDPAALQSDIDAFLLQLFSLGILTDEAGPAACCRYMKIGDTVIGYHGPENLLHPSLLDFSDEPAAIGQHWIVEIPPAYPPQLTGTVLLRTKEMTVSRNQDFYIINYFHATSLIETHIALDGSHAHFYCVPPFDEALAEKLFHAFRFAFLVYAQRNGLFAIHASSILYQDKAWLFSASSGTGKSTHAGLWNRLYQTPVLNGDLSLIGFQDAQPVVWGLPWCGTSGIYFTGSYPLGGITLLRQHPENKVSVLKESEAQLRVMQRLISPSWTEEMMDYNLDFTDKLVDCAPVFHLLCTKDPSAAQIMKQAIDRIK